MRTSLVFCLLTLGGAMAGALGACVGDEPGTTGTGAPDGAAGNDGSALPDSGAPDGAGDADDAGDAGEVEPTPDGGILSVEDFSVHSSFPGGVAKVAFAADGSLFVGFTFRGQTSIGGTQLSSDAASDDIGVAKFKPDGKLAWLRRFGGAGAEALYGLAVDAAGDVYLAGDYRSASIDFEVARTLGGVSSAAFVAKLAGATGAAVKSVTFHKPTVAGGRCDAVAARAGVIAVGCTMDGVADVTMSTGGTADVSPPGSGAGMLFAELDPTSLGALWANGLGSDAGDFVSSVDVTPAGDLVFAAVSGSASDVALTDTKGSINVTVRRSPTALIGRLARASGLASWVKPFGSATAGAGLRAQGIASDMAANIVFCAQLTGTIDIGGKAVTRANPSAPSFEGMVVAKLRPDGTTVEARSFGGSSDELVRGIATDRWNNVLVTGRYTSTDFVIDGHTMPAPAASGNQVLFALKMNPSLVAQWGFGATTGDGALIQGQGVGAAPSGKVAYVGIFAGTADFGDGSPRQSANAGAGVNAVIVTRSP